MEIADFMYNFISIKSPMSEKCKLSDYLLVCQVKSTLKSPLISSTNGVKRERKVLHIICEISMPLSWSIVIPCLLTVHYYRPSLFVV
jgi:hypothetical protein